MVIVSYLKNNYPKKIGHKNIENIFPRNFVIKLRPCN